MVNVDLLPRAANGCPYLLLAPMEGVGDRPFRKAIATIGGFDEAVTEFMRVPKNAHVKSLAKQYQSHEIAPFPLAAQIMGSDVDLMADMACELESRGAPRIDINCGCPSAIVTGRGAGSSLLKDPSFLHSVAKGVVKAVSVPVTIKMRSGYEDTSLFEDNILAAQESGVAYITLHPRTKVDGYGPPAKWEYIQRAKSLLKIPVVGNGDILSVSDALRMLSKTGCDALMIGRGSVINPFIFLQIKAHYEGASFIPRFDMILEFIRTYEKELYPELSERGKINKMKQLFGFLAKLTPSLVARRERILGITSTEYSSFMDKAIEEFQSGFLGVELVT